jgi:prepilin-type N-terminal cleavage/methylation domain-containing protein
MTFRASRTRRGFLLLEVVIALAVFGIAATALAVAFHRMGQAADLAQNEMRITRILESALNETLSLPTLEEGTTSQVLAERGMEIETKIELMKEELENEDGQLLQEMYRITITGRWVQNGLQNERTAETWRYARLYQSP